MTTFNPKSLLGGALLGQKKYADAEPLLLAGYEGMKQREKTIPPQGKILIPEAIERLVQLYEATDKKDEAAKWRKQLEARKAAQKPPAARAAAGKEPIYLFIHVILRVLGSGWVDSSHDRQGTMSRRVVRGLRSA